MVTPVRLDHDWFPRDLPANVLMGDRSWIYSSYSCLHCRSTQDVAVRIGSGSGVYHGTFFELAPTGSVTIGNWCTLVGATICASGHVAIGDYTFIAHEVVIADSAFILPHVPGAPGPSGTSIEIGENVWIGARAIVVGPVTIGEGAIIGAGALVDRDVPPFAVAVGNPLRILRRSDPSEGA